MSTSESQDRVPVQPILRPVTQDRPRAPDSSAATSRTWLPFAALGLLILIAAAVFFYLPKFVSTPAPVPPSTTQTPAATSPIQPAPTAEDIDYLKLAQDMAKAEEARGAYDSLIASYEKRGAAQWAGDAFAAARTKGAQALKEFEAREFTPAQHNYQAALTDLHKVGEIADSLLKQQLTAGAQALDHGRSVAAREAFEFALKIDPENATAANGLKRAGTLDQVFAAFNAAAAAERAGDMTNAVKGYQEALKIDPQLTAASEGLARVQGRVSADNFAQAVSAGTSALASGQPQQARAAFARAARIKPDAVEVKEGLSRVALLEAQQTILGHRQRAEAMEREERWGEALAEYDAALKLDSTLQFAQQGRARTQPRNALHAQFEVLINKPDRLLTPAVRTQAQAMLVEAAKVTSPGPVLSRQMTQLKAELARAETPVAVALRSDGQTHVVVNRVAQIGTFTQHQLQLLPGRYTAVGTRQGYRDVRKDFTVQPGEPPAPLTVQCEEKI